jgi:hypothetical protein
MHLFKYFVSQKKTVKSLAFDLLSFTGNTKKQKNNRTYHNWKLAVCVESQKSIPIETVMDPSGSRESRK